MACTVIHGHWLDLVSFSETAPPRDGLVLSFVVGRPRRELREGEQRRHIRDAQRDPVRYSIWPVLGRERVGPHRHDGVRDRGLDLGHLECLPCCAWHRRRARDATHRQHVVRNKHSGVLV